MKSSKHYDSDSSSCSSRDQDDREVQMEAGTRTTDDGEELRLSGYDVSDSDYDI